MNLIKQFELVPSAYCAFQTEEFQIHLNANALADCIVKIQILQKELPPPIPKECLAPQDLFIKFVTEQDVHYGNCYTCGELTAINDDILCYKHAEEDDE